MKLFDIKRASLTDGEGIRTVVFFKGCPLSCRWCHNPESHHAETELAFAADKCLHCGSCARSCPAGAQCFADGIHSFRRDVCTACGTCVSHCGTGALTLYGYEKSVEEVLKICLQDEPFYRFSGGGVTLSGGEPLMQSRDAITLARALRERGISVSAETSGFGSREELLALARYTDCFLYDWKVPAEDYRSHTGADGAFILQNLLALDRADTADIILRCPIIPGVNLTERHFAGIAELAGSLRRLMRIDLLPYHPAGLHKYQELERTAGYSSPDFLDRQALEVRRQALADAVPVPVAVP